MVEPVRSSVCGAKLGRAVVRRPSIPKEPVEQFLTGPTTQEAINAAGSAFKQAPIEASPNAELSHHLNYRPGEAKPEATTNERNGGTTKTVLTGDGSLRIAAPRDRDGTFEPMRCCYPRTHAVSRRSTTASTICTRAE